MTIPPAPSTYTQFSDLSAAQLRSDVLNALDLFTQPPVFCGAMTGVPVPFTASASANVFTAPGTNYAEDQQVYLANTSPTPGGYTAGRVYNVVNPGTAGSGQFQLSGTAGGLPITITGNGAGTVFQTQQIASGTTWAQLGMDTELADPLGGHQTTTSPSQYFGMFPGWYLAEFTWAPVYFGGTGSVSAGIVATENGGSPVTIGGARGPASATSGKYAQPSVVKLLSFTSVGTYGGTNADWAAGACYQDSGTIVIPLTETARGPFLNLEWVSLPTGNPLLPVPDNDAWPVPPQYVTAAFLNKNVRDSVNFLAFRPVCEATFTAVAGAFTLAAQSSLPAVGTTVPLDTIHADTYSAFNTGTGVWTCKRPGVYGVYGQFSATARSTSTAIAAGITVTSANYNSGSAYTVWSGAQAALTSGVSSVLVSRRLRLNYGDTLKLAGFQADSGSNSTTAATGTWKSRLITVFRAR